GVSLVVLTALAAPVLAGEYVVLANGFRLHADRHEIEAGTARIFSGSGVVEMPVTAISGYEQEEITATVEPPAVVAAAPLPVAAAKPETPAELAAEVAKKYVLPDSFVRSVMKAESGFRPDAVSPKGAIGLMQ